MAQKLLQEVKNADMDGGGGVNISEKNANAFYG